MASTALTVAGTAGRTPCPTRDAIGHRSDPGSESLLLHCRGDAFHRAFPAVRISTSLWLPLALLVVRFASAVPKTHRTTVLRGAFPVSTPTYVGQCKPGFCRTQGLARQSPARVAAAECDVWFQADVSLYRSASILPQRIRESSR